MWVLYSCVILVGGDIKKERGMVGSDAFARYARPVIAGKGGNAGIRFAEQYPAHASARENLTALLRAQRAGGVAFYNERLHGAVFVAYHAAVDGGAIGSDGEAARPVHGFGRGPVEATSLLVILVVGVTTLAAAVTQYRPAELLHHTYGRGNQLSARRRRNPHLGSVQRLPDLMELVAAAVWT